MKVLCIALLTLGLAACNGGTTGSDSAGSAAQPEAVAEPAAQAAGGLVNSALQKATDPNVQGCLAKVKAGAFQEALPLCLKAANVEPDNKEVQDALATARQKAAVDVSQAAEAKKQLNTVGEAAKGMKLP